MINRAITIACPLSDVHTNDFALIAMDSEYSN